MEEIRITFRELGFYILIGNIILGVLFGSLPLIAGLKLKNRKYGFIGFIGSILGGTLLGVFLSYPLALLFVWLIVRMPATPELADVDPVTS